MMLEKQKERKVLLSVKDLIENPWSDIESKFNSGDKLSVSGSTTIGNSVGDLIFDVNVSIRTKSCSR